MVFIPEHALRMTTENKQDEYREAAPIHGDALEVVFTQLPLIYVAPSCHVSREWRRAVFSSLRSFNKVKPWLIIHTQSRRSPCLTSTHAYDPRSHVWIDIERPPANYSSALRSSHSSLLYVLTPSKFSFSSDPLNLTWHHVAAPRVWRTDPIVAIVSGDQIVVAGGTCDFEDDPLAVEMYDIKTRTWTTCQSMSTEFKDSAAATWLSVAVKDGKMFVIEKRSSRLYTFDTSTKSWGGPYDLRPDRCMLSSVISTAGDRLILVGVIGDDSAVENVNSIKLWEVNAETFERREIGVMPATLAEKLTGVESSNQLSSITVNSSGDIVYLCNPSEPDEVIFCELGDGSSGVCRWECLPNMIVNDRNLMGRFVLTCSHVGVGDIQMALRLGNWKFSVKNQSF